MKYLLFCLLLLSHLSYSQHFKAIIPQTNASFRGLSVVDDNIAWVSGSKGWVGKSSDAGGTWDLKQVKGFETSDFRTLYAFDAKTAIIANAGTPGYILRTDDGGNNWIQVYKNEDSAVFFDGVDFCNDKEGVIYGDPIGGRMLLLSTSDGGRTWKEFPEQQRPALETGEASFAASGTCIKCMKEGRVVIATGGNISRLWVSENKGKSWSTITTPILQGQNSRGIFSFAFKNKKEGVIVGGDYKIDSLATANVFCTKNTGKSWIRPTVPTRGYRECVMYLEKNTLIATGPSGTDISYTNGKTWEPLSDDKQYHVVKKSRKGSLVIMAGGGGKIAVFTKN